jgi:predicted AAA+ superfamily ATPase
LIATRGLVTVVHALWAGDGRPGALIGQATLSLTDERVRNTFFEQVDAERQYREWSRPTSSLPAG